ncbi:MAG TPA: hypothetical protein VJA94_13965 [Candidatus Angelobacter sp.]
MKAIRLLAGAAGVAFLILTLPILFNDPNDPLSTKIGFAAISFVAGVLLLSFGARVKVRWTPVWAIGWFLAVCGAFQVLYSVNTYNHATNATDKFGSFLWALLAPLQVYWGVRLFKIARRASTPKLEELDPSDSRAPVLFLRPFEADSRTAKVRTGKDMTSLVFNTRTEEELVAQVLNDIGQCVAIGRPHEKLPQLGFRRIYLNDEQQWQDKVLEYMQQAQIVVLLVGSSANFLWELSKALELVRPERLLFLIPSEKERQLMQSLLAHAPPEIPKNAVFSATAFRAVLYFDPDWTPHYAIPEAPSHFRQTRAEKITSPLKMALRPVYMHLKQQWKKPPLVWSKIVYEAAVALSVLFVLRIIFFGLVGQ